jgi:TRAP-type C4-dicarboxylate transport system permease small subunit
MRSVGDIIWKAFDVTALLAFSVMLVLVTAQIVFRYCLQVSVPWTEEAARWFYAWQIFLGSAVAMREKLHLKVTILIDHLPTVAQNVLNLLMGVAGLIFLVGIVWGSLIMIRSVYPVQAGSFPISTSYLYLSIPAGLIAMVILSIREVVEAARQLARPGEGR